MLIPADTSLGIFHDAEAPTFVAIVPDLLPHFQNRLCVKLLDARFVLTVTVDPIVPFEQDGVDALAMVVRLKFPDADQLYVVSQRYAQEKAIPRFLLPSALWPTVAVPDAIVVTVPGVVPFTEIRLCVVFAREYTLLPFIVTEMA